MSRTCRTSGLNVPGAIAPASDPGTARELVWGLAWRGNVPFVGQAYCVGGKSLYWGRVVPAGCCASDLAAWPPSVATYLNNNYPILEQQTGVSVATDFIQGSLFNLLKQRVTNAIGTVPNLDTRPRSTAGRAGPVPGLRDCSASTSTPARHLTIEAARDAASVPDAQRRFFAVPNAHVTRIHTTAGAASSIDVIVNGALQSLPVHSTCAVILALGTIESTRSGPGLVPHQPREPGRRADGAKPDGALALQYLRPNQPRRGSTRATPCRRPSRRARYSCAGRRHRESSISKSLRRRILKVTLTISCFR